MTKLQPLRIPVNFKTRNKYCFSCNQPAPLSQVVPKLWFHLHVTFMSQGLTPSRSEGTETNLVPRKNGKALLLLQESPLIPTALRCTQKVTQSSLIQGTSCGGSIPCHKFFQERRARRFVVALQAEQKIDIQAKEP